MHQPGGTESREVKAAASLPTSDRSAGLLRAVGQGRRLAGRRPASFSALARTERVALWAAGIGLLFALIAPGLAPHGPTTLVGIPLSPPSGAHLLGTDDQGRELLARILYGMRTSVLSAAVVIASGVLIGGVIGLVAGMAGGILDALLMRLTDLFLALPGPLLVLAIVGALGPSLKHTLIGVCIVWWPWYARVMRGQARATVAMPHVEAARLAGLSRMRVALKHVLPSSFGPIVVTASLDVGNVILLLASLSFLGLGSPDPASELGSMTARGLTYLFTNWNVAVLPAAAVFILVFIANFAGDAIRDLVEG
jgi:peptide/nickel transport system permease protein